MSERRDDEDDARERGGSLPLDEASFRSLLDERGIVRPGALALPARGDAWAVFSQAKDVRLGVDALRANAARFFEAKLGLTVDKRYDDDVPVVDAARVVLSSADAAGTRLCIGRMTQADDVAAVEAAERAAGTYGLALLAERCPTMWLVVPSIDADRVALTLAAIFASVMLGPIVTPGGGETFGVRTARMKLESRVSPYR